MTATEKFILYRLFSLWCAYDKVNPAKPVRIRKRGNLTLQVSALLVFRRSRNSEVV
jgi:hypothetical protein